MTEAKDAQALSGAATEPFQPRNTARRYLAKRRISLDYTHDEYDRLKALAKREGVSLRRLVREAVWYAVAHMEAKP
jgi:hypothetical protein